MQGGSIRRSNRERTQATRAVLIAAARALFVEKGYAKTGTPEIATAAKLTRGALYHHFADKADLFATVVLCEAQAVAAQIERETADGKPALDILMDGAEGYFTAMAIPGRVRLLLQDGPSVLGYAEMDRIDKETGGAQLRQGLAYAMAEGGHDDARRSALLELLSAAFDRAALAIAEGRPAKAYKAAVRQLLTGLLDGERQTGQSTNP